MKIQYIIISFAILVLTACSEAEIPTYLGTQAIQFAEQSDSTLSYMFYYDEASVKSATIHFKLLTTGHVFDVDRSYQIKQILQERDNAAEEGKHFEAFFKGKFVVEAGKVTAYAPITIYRENLEPKKIYQLVFQIENNENFIKGDTSLLIRKLIFSRDLLRPNEWTDQRATYYLGPYSVNKHAWMIEQTGKKWDDEFIRHSFGVEQLHVYWRDRLNNLLRKYKQTHGPLLDDDGYEIEKFGKA